MNFSSPRQSKTVAAGKHAMIYEQRVPGGMKGLITSIANIFYRNTHYVISIDGEPLWDKIEHEIAAINNPRQLSEYIVVKRKIEVIGYNNSDESVTMEFFIDGIFVQKEKIRSGE